MIVVSFSTTSNYFSNIKSFQTKYSLFQKIVEKFHRNDEVPASKDIAVREFDFVENEIRLTYHYSEGQYTQATRTFLKPPITERGDRLVFLPQMTHGYNVNNFRSKFQNINK